VLKNYYSVVTALVTRATENRQTPWRNVGLVAAFRYYRPVLILAHFSFEIS
jgi:hypothetical protein